MAVDLTLNMQISVCRLASMGSPSLVL